MDVTIDIKALLIVLVLIALIVLIVFCIFLIRRLIETLTHANKVLEDVEVISQIAASRSEDLDGIIDNVSEAATGLSGAMSEGSFVSTVSSVARSVASLRGLLKEEDEETRAAKKSEKRTRRKKHSDD